jgi:hypothetical protein
MSSYLAFSCKRRHFCLSCHIPKILRRRFCMTKRLTDLSFTSFAKHKAAAPGAVIAIQTFGDLLGDNPHLHVIISDGCFHKSGMLTVAPAIDRMP